MKSYAIAAQIAALISVVSAQAACGNPANVVCNSGGQSPLMQSGSRINICDSTTGATIAPANALPQSQTAGVASAAACAQLCNGVTACVRSNFVASSGACTLGNVPVTAAELQTNAASAPTTGFAFNFYLPPCAVSSSSIAPVSSSVAVVASSSAAVVASSSAAVVASSSVAVASSSAAVVASSSSAVASPSASAAASTGPSCPASNGQAFTASTSSGNSVFTITCGSGTVGKRGLPAPIARRQVAAPLNAFGICITACANVATCQSLLFNPVNGACALFDCIVPVPAGLSGATRVTSPGGGAFVGRACPNSIPTTIPAGSTASNGTAPVTNLNLNINVNVNVNVIAGKYKGVPYTQICATGKCQPCDVCEQTPVEKCSVCEAKNQPSPLKPSTTYCPPGVPGKAGFPGTCTDCAAPKAPVAPAAPSMSTVPYSAPTSSTGGKYTGPMSNDAASHSGMTALFGGVAALAFALA